MPAPPSWNKSRKKNIVISMSAFFLMIFTERIWECMCRIVSAEWMTSLVAWWSVNAYRLSALVFKTASLTAHHPENNGIIYVYIYIYMYNCLLSHECETFFLFSPLNNQYYFVKTLDFYFQNCRPNSFLWGKIAKTKYLIFILYKYIQN